MKHIIMHLESPLMAFGGETIDNLGVVRRFPAASMLTGMFANALGWRRIDREKHQALQDRLVFAARIEREPAGGVSMQDFQTVRIGEGTDLFMATDRKDRRRKYVVGWTTTGDPDFRGGDLGRDGFTHRRWRDYFADMRVCVTLRLRDTDDAHAPTLDELANALEYPKRPLFIGRKLCLPSVALFGGLTDKGETCVAVLLDAPLAYPEEAPRSVAMQWPGSEEVDLEATGIRITRSQILTDERNWVSGLHGGGRLVHEGSVDKSRFGQQDTPAECDKDGEG